LESGEKNDIKKFLKTIESFYQSIIELTPLLNDFFANTAHFSSPNNARSVQKLVDLICKCIKTSDNLKSVSSSLSPAKRDNDLVSLVLQTLNPVSTNDSSPYSIVKLGLPVMR
jgi:ABC-type transporter Mla subunit MlaD